MSQLYRVFLHHEESGDTLTVGLVLAKGDEQALAAVPDGRVALARLTMPVSGTFLTCEPLDGGPDRVANALSDLAPDAILHETPAACLRGLCMFFGYGFDIASIRDHADTLADAWEALDNIESLSEIVRGPF